MSKSSRVVFAVFSGKCKFFPKSARAQRFLQSQERSDVGWAPAKSAQCALSGPTCRTGRDLQTLDSRLRLPAGSLEGGNDEENGNDGSFGASFRCGSGRFRWRSLLLGDRGFYLIKGIISGNFPLNFFQMPFRLIGWPPRLRGPSPAIL